MKFNLILFILFYFNIFSQEKVNIKYQTLNKAYIDYDTLFFNKIKNTTLTVIYKKKDVRVYYNQEITVIFDWYLNKKKHVGEYGYKKYSDSLILFIYNLVDKKGNKILKYNILFTGSKPQIIFKKGRKNWYKIKKLQDCVLVKEEYVYE
jgi:hypothetical protein